MLTNHCTPRASERNPLAFAPLPHALRKDPRLTTRAVTLAAALLEHARDQPRCDPTNRRLAADDHCSIRTVQYALASLRAAGWIAVEQGPDGRVIRLLWREAPGDAPPDPLQQAAEPPCNHLPDPVQPSAEPPCNASQDKERSAERRRNVTDVPLPEGPQTAPEEPVRLAPAPRPSEPVRPLLAELKAIPGADGPKVRSLAWRLAHHLKDVASIGFFVMVLGLVAQGLAPVERLLAAFRVADRSRGKAQKPGAIFVSTWSGWQPPPLPSAINRPVYYQAPRPPEPRLEPPAPPAPAPGVVPPGAPPPEIEPPEGVGTRRPKVAAETLRQWETWAAQPGFYLQEHARKKLAEYRAQEPAPDGP